MHCKDCLHYKEWRATSIATCQKNQRSVSPTDRPCDEFVLRRHLTDEWGQKAGGSGCCER